MHRTIQLQKNAAVLTVDGQTVGSLNRVVVEPEQRTLNAIVVRTGGLFKKTVKLIPIQWVTMLGTEHIHLKMKKSELDELPEASKIG